MNGHTAVRNVQCCVVGGGPGGMMAGALLARAGVETLVLEKHADFLRDFRGDTVHPSTLEVLGELGWLEDFLRRPHQELTRLRAVVEGREVVLADVGHVPTRRRFVALVPQWDFLDFVAAHARRLPRFTLSMRTNVADLVLSDARVVGVRAQTDEGALEVHADLVVAADGRRSILRERAGLQVRDVGAPMDVLWMRVSRREGDPPESLGWLHRGRMLVLLARDDYWQLGLLIRKGRFDATRARGIDAFRRELAETSPLLADRLSELAHFDDVKLLVVKVDRLERWWRPGLLCIGDAAHAMSPIGGVGINLAIQDAVAAANLLAAPLRAGELRDGDLARVQRRREPPTRATQALQVWVQRRVIDRVLSGDRPLRAGPMLRLLSRSHTLQRITGHLIGVGFRPEHVANNARHAARLGS